MITIELSSFLMQLKDGAIANVGASNKSATVKLYDVESANARAFGDERVKFVFEDDEGNEVEVAVFPEEIEAIEDALADVRAAGTVEGYTH